MDISFFIEILKKGGIVAFPTETVYGLGASAWDASAIKKVFEAKGRPADNPLIVHISSTDQILRFTNDVPENAHKIMNAFWPGPITIIFKKKPEVLDSITAGLDTVAIRMPDHPLALALIEKTGPLVAPSANTSGRPSPTKAEHVINDFGADFPVIDGGSTQLGLESTVIDLTTSKPMILRPGSIGKTELEAVLHTSVWADVNLRDKPRSPGQKYSHYKPKASVRWLQSGESPSQLNTLYLMIAKGTSTKNSVFYDGDLASLARELYDQFRQADIHGFSDVVIEPFSHLSGLFPSLFSALMNRIEKAIGA